MFWVSIFLSRQQQNLSHSLCGNGCCVSPSLMYQCSTDLGGTQVCFWVKAEEVKYLFTAEDIILTSFAWRRKVLVEGSGELGSRSGFFSKRFINLDQIRNTNNTSDTPAGI